MDRDVLTIMSLAALAISVYQWVRLRMVIGAMKENFDKLSRYEAETRATHQRHIDDLHRGPERA